MVQAGVDNDNMMLKRENYQVSMKLKREGGC